MDGDSSIRAKAAFSRMLTKAQRAHHLLRRRCHTMEIYNVDILTHLFDSLVKPILNFGCEVWAPSILNNTHITNDHACEKWHRSILKQMLGVCQSTTSNIIMEELGRTPVCFAWLKQALRFWNKIIDKEPDDLIRMALEESFESNTGWVHDLRCALRKLGSSTSLNTMEIIDVEDIMSEVFESWSFKYPSDSNEVRDIPNERRAGFKRLRYQKWFAANYSDDNGLIPFTSALHKRDQIRTIAQFRMGSHWLNSERKRLVDGIHIPRSMRHCQLCGFQKPEDEMHVFEFPFYNDIRPRYQKLLTYIIIYI